MKCFRRCVIFKHYGVHNTFQFFFSVKCKTPNVPQEARMDEGDTADDDVDDGVEEEEVNADEEDDKATQNEGSGSTQTAEKGQTSAQVARKLCAVQQVENNRKKIVESGHQLKTLRAMKAEKQKREEAFYFIETKASVDKRAHWQELDCAVIPDYESDQPSIVKSVKKLKTKPN